MSNAMKYIKDLEAAGFQRHQAEAQVQMVLDALEGDLATKNDLNILQEKTESQLTQFQTQVDLRFNQFQTQMDLRFAQAQAQMDSRFVQSESHFERRLVETEFRLITRLGFLTVSTTSVAVAVLTWLIKLP